MSFPLSLGNTIASLLGNFIEQSLKEKVILLGVYTILMDVSLIW